MKLTGKRSGFPMTLWGLSEREINCRELKKALASITASERTRRRNRRPAPLTKAFVQKAGT
jgi:hypothetical protein